MIKQGYHAVHDEVRRLADQALHGEYVCPDKLSDNFKYDVDAVRPKIFNLAVFAEAKVMGVLEDRCGQIVLTNDESNLGHVGVFIKSDSPIWLDVRSVDRYNLTHSNDTPSVKTSAPVIMTVEGVLGEERELFNLSQVINVDELVAAGVLPKFQPRLSSYFW